jgi:hypothetical protein
MSGLTGAFVTLALGTVSFTHPHYGRAANGIFAPLRELRSPLALMNQCKRALEVWPPQPIEKKLASEQLLQCRSEPINKGL